MSTGNRVPCPGQTGVFYVAAPGGLEFDAAAATAGRPAGTDDDAINVELADLMRVISSDWGNGGPKITTIKELYAALSDAFVGKDVNGDGVIDATQAQVDDIFLRHGFFDDLDGDRQYNQASDGDIGGTAHPAATVSMTQFKAIIPRSSALGFEGSYVTIDTSGVNAEMLVQVEVPGDSGVESYAYWASTGSNEPVELAVPSANGEQAAVTVIAAAAGHNPAVAFRVTAEQFHTAVDSGEQQSQPARSQVKMSVGDPFAVLNDGVPTDSPGGYGSNTPPWTMILPILLAAIMLGGGV